VNALLAMFTTETKSLEKAVGGRGGEDRCHFLVFLVGIWNERQVSVGEGSQNGVDDSAAVGGEVVVGREWVGLG